MNARRRNNCFQLDWIGICEQERNGMRENLTTQGPSASHTLTRLR